MCTGPQLRVTSLYAQRGGFAFQEYRLECLAHYDSSGGGEDPGPVQLVSRSLNADSAVRIPGRLPVSILARMSSASSDAA
jgi:hypothetical protein